MGGETITSVGIDVGTSTTQLILDVYKRQGSCCKFVLTPTDVYTAFTVKAVSE